MIIILCSFGIMRAGGLQNPQVLEVTGLLVRMVVVFATVVLVTLPFGFYRAYTRKLSLRWFLAIHVPVVFVFLVRFESHLSYAFIPFTCLAFAIAQILGTRIGRWWIRRRPAARIGEEQKASVSQSFSNQA